MTNITNLVQEWLSIIQCITERAEASIGVKKQKQ